MPLETPLRTLRKMASITQVYTDIFSILKSRTIQMIIPRRMLNMSLRSMVSHQQRRAIFADSTRGQRF